VTKYGILLEAWTRSILQFQFSFLLTSAVIRKQHETHINPSISVSLHCKDLLFFTFYGTRFRVGREYTSGYYNLKISLSGASSWNLNPIITEGLNEHGEACLLVRRVVLHSPNHAVTSHVPPPPGQIYY